MKKIISTTFFLLATVLSLSSPSATVVHADSNQSGGFFERYLDENNKLTLDLANNESHQSLFSHSMDSDWNISHLGEYADYLDSADIATFFESDNYVYYEEGDLIEGITQAGNGGFYSVNDSNQYFELYNSSRFLNLYFDPDLASQHGNRIEMAICCDFEFLLGFLHDLKDGYSIPIIKVNGTTMIEANKSDGGELSISAKGCDFYYNRQILAFSMPYIDSVRLLEFLNLTRPVIPGNTYTEDSHRLESMSGYPGILIPDIYFNSSYMKTNYIFYISEFDYLNDKIVFKSEIKADLQEENFEVNSLKVNSHLYNLSHVRTTLERFNLQYNIATIEYSLIDNNPGTNYSDKLHSLSLSVSDIRYRYTDGRNDTSWHDFNFAIMYRYTAMTEVHEMRFRMLNTVASRFIYVGLIPYIHSYPESYFALYDESVGGLKIDRITSLSFRYFKHKEHYDIPENNPNRISKSSFVEITGTNLVDFKDFYHQCIQFITGEQTTFFTVKESNSGWNKSYEASTETWRFTQTVKEGAGLYYLGVEQPYNFKISIDKPYYFDSILYASYQTEAGDTIRLSSYKGGLYTWTDGEEIKIFDYKGNDVSDDYYVVGGTIIDKNTGLEAANNAQYDSLWNVFNNFFEKAGLSDSIKRITQIVLAILFIYLLIKLLPIISRLFSRSRK